MVVRKREGELVFQVVQVFREGVDLPSHPPGVLAYRQVIALHPIGIDRVVDRRRLQGRFDLRGSAIDDAGRDVDHPTVGAFFDDDP